jgi:hypothetical protein
MDEKRKAQLEKENEIGLYLTIDAIGAFIWRMRHDYHHGRIENSHWPEIQKDIEKMSETQMFAVSQLTRFGVEKPQKDDNKSPTAEYWAWFRWWDAWKKNMSDAEWNELNEKINLEQDISSYRPTGDWHLTIADEQKKMEEAEKFQQNFKG